MAEISVGSAVFMVVVLLVFAVFYEKGKKRFQEYLVPLDKKDFPLKDLMPVGFAVMAFLKYQYNTSFDRKNRKLLKELQDPEYVEFYMRVYWAKAATYAMVALGLGGMVSLAADDPVMGLVIGIGLSGILVYFTWQGLQNTVQERHVAIAMDMPELVNKIVILTGAGLNTQGALAMITREMHSERLLYQELAHVMKLIDAGEPVDAAFDYLGAKCNMPEMRRLISIILQNIYRSGSDMSVALKGIGEELWTARKATALRVTEEASTKMLFPMMLMLFAVILLVIAPAVQGMQF